MEVPGPDHLGEESQLCDGTADFTGQPCRGQPGLGHGTVDDRFAHGFDVVRDRLEEGGPLCRRGRPVAGECLRSGIDGGIDLCFVEECVVGSQSLPGARVDGVGSGAVSGDRFPGDEGESSERGHKCQAPILISVLGWIFAAAMRSARSATSCSLRLCSGGRTGPASRPMALSPPLTMETPYPLPRSRMSR